jgi:hypothetical protein
MAAVLGKSSDDTSGMLHDLLEQLSIPKDTSP